MRMPHLSIVVFERRGAPEAHELASIEPGALHVVGTDGSKALLKKVQAVPKGSEEPKAVFETRCT